jgi:serine/threonine protein kinase
MDAALAGGALPAPFNFHDGLGERRRTTDASGDTVERLCLRRQLTSIPSFEFALRERTGRLASFRHTYFGRVRSIDRLSDPAAALAVVSDFTKGVRLSQLLTPAVAQPVTIDINAALHLIRQIVSSVAMLHENAPDVAHGAIGPERIVVTSNARVVIVEYVLGAALEQLRYSPEQYWKDLRIALPPYADEPRFDHRADVTQIGVVALSLVLGRLLTDEEYPARIGDVLGSAWAISARGGLEPLPGGLRSWLGRALQLDPRHSFESAIDACAELDRVLDGEDEAEYEGLAASAVTNVPETAAAPPPPVQPAVTERHEAEATYEAHVDPPAAKASERTDVWEPFTPAPETKPGASPAPRPVAIAAEPKPVVSAPEPKPVASVIEPKPVASAPEPKPAASVPEWKPVASMPEPKPASSTFPAPPTLFAPPTSSSANIVPPVSAVAPADGLFKSIYHDDDAQTDSASVVHQYDEPVDAVDDDEAPAGRARSVRRWTRIGAAAFALISVSAIATYGAMRYLATPVSATSPGVLHVVTNPPGAQVNVDSETRGTTPLTLTLDPGTHTVQVHNGSGDPRTIPVTITAGAVSSQYIELPTAAAVPMGSLQIRTDPAGARVSVDGVARGKSPVLVEDLAAGEHAVVLEGDFGSVKHTVTVQPATMASLMVPLTPAETAPVSGWVTLTAPVELQLFENKRLLGTTESDRIMVTAGRHEIEIVNETLGYRTSSIVQVAAGKVAPIKIDWPTGTIALNASPWAEVWIDGTKSGETPIGNLSLPIGPHEVVFRHPELGEQRHAVTVSLKEKARLSVDLKKKP